MNTRGVDIRESEKRDWRDTALATAVAILVMMGAALVAVFTVYAFLPCS